MNIYESDKTDDEKYDAFDNLDNEFYNFKGIAYKKLYDKFISYIRELVK